MAIDNTYQAIATQTLGSATASVTFSSISGSYTDIVLVVTIGNSANGTRDLVWNVNSDTSALYSTTALAGNGGTASSSKDTAFTYLRTNGSSNNSPSTCTIIQLMNYSNSTTYKTMLSRSNSTGWVMAANAHLWRSTAAITSITIKNESATNLVSGSTFTLYGIKAA
jgi:hypothetical protein